MFDDWFDWATLDVSQMTDEELSILYETFFSDEL
jgi:hypothetical protein